MAVGPTNGQISLTNQNNYTLYIPYTEEFINRRAELRRNHDELMSRINSEQSVIIPTTEDLNLINQKTQSLIKLKPSKSLVENSRNHSFLGELDNRLVFSVDCSHLKDSELSKIRQTYDFIDLRAVGSNLNAIDASLAVYTRGLQYWHRTHIFCARCATPTRITEGGHSRTCTSPKCEHITYPRIAPAAIVLIEHFPTDGSAPKCLLGKGNRSWGNVRSTLAGFTEVGESLEETVKREMEEEAGIKVYNIRYMGSQPWPFPSSLMVGFFAESNETELVLEEEEISEADWYTVEDLERQVASGELVLSRQDSIARYLIESWIEKIKAL